MDTVKQYFPLSTNTSLHLKPIISLIWIPQKQKKWILFKLFT